MNRRSIESKRLRCAFGVVFICVSLVAPLWAGVSFYYEKAVTDAWGNELGYQSVLVTSLDQLPAGSPWRTYFSSQVRGYTLWDYVRLISQSLSQPLTLKFSDRNSVSASYRSTNGYSINLYKPITQYSSDDSKKFVCLHEIGHVAMLNAYPKGYAFSGLDYGSDNLHTLDEILPNANTAWVEGWANAFGASKLNGKIFSLSFNDDTITAFLVNNTFEEMTRNELFVGKMLYDMMATFQNGQDKVFNIMSTTGPHSSLRDFCRAYIKTYPSDQVALAKLLDKNGYSKASLSEMLDYVNNGSNVVSQEFYSYLQQRGSLQTTSSNTSTTAQTTKKSFWSRIVDFFANLFGIGNRNTSTAAAGQSPQSSVSIAPTPISMNGSTSSQTSISPLPPASEVSNQSSDLTKELAVAQEEYFAAFAAYNAALAKRPPDQAAVQSALVKFKNAKSRLNEVTQALKSR